MPGLGRRGMRRRRAGFIRNYMFVAAKRRLRRLARLGGLRRMEGVVYDRTCHSGWACRNDVLPKEEESVHNGSLRSLQLWLKFRPQYASRSRFHGRFFRLHCLKLPSIPSSASNPVCSQRPSLSLAKSRWELEVKLRCGITFGLTSTTLCWESIVSSALASAVTTVVSPVSFRQWVVSPTSQSQIVVRSIDTDAMTWIPEVNSAPDAKSAGGTWRVWPQQSLASFWSHVSDFCVINEPASANWLTDETTRDVGETAR